MGDERKTAEFKAQVSHKLAKSNKAKGCGEILRFRGAQQGVIRALSGVQAGIVEIVRADRLFRHEKIEGGVWRRCQYGLRLNILLPPHAQKGCFVVALSSGALG